MAGDRPNVLLILCDDLCTQMEPYSQDGALTPAIARLASRGVTFTRAYCQQSQGGPSRASFLSGRYPEKTGVLKDSLHLREVAPDVVPLPQLLREAGYWTASAGRVFQDGTHDYNLQAWDRVVRSASDELPMVVQAHQEFLEEFGPIHKSLHMQWRRVVDELGPQTRGEMGCGYGPSGLSDEQHAEGKDAREVSAWLREAAFGDKPFFIAFGLKKPHVPFVVPEPYFDIYSSTEFPPAATAKGEWLKRSQHAGTRRYEHFGFRLGEPDESLRRIYLQAYFASASFADAQIGVVLDSLADSEFAENTVVIVTSDEGFHLGDHGLWGKDTLFEQCLRVPLIVTTPDCPAPGTFSDGIVGLIDLFPTITELCGLAPSDAAQGSSLAGLLAGDSRAAPGEAYSVTSRGPIIGRSLRTDRWRFTEWEEKEPAELYDHENDPDELVNLAGEPEHAGVEKDLRARLYELAARVSGGSFSDDSDR